MLKNPIPQVTDPLQYRAIGIVNGKFTPHDREQLNKGLIIDNEGEKIETVVLGKALSILKKHIDLNKNYYWVVYPKNKNTKTYIYRLQVSGILYNLTVYQRILLKINFSKLLEELDLKDNYFSVRGELVFVNKSKKEIVIKICSTSKLKNLKNKNFKLVIKGELSLELLNNFVSLDINREGNSLKLLNYEVISKNFSKNN